MTDSTSPDRRRPPRARHSKAPTAAEWRRRASREFLADLNDWLTDPQTGQMTGLAEEAYATCRAALIHRGDDRCHLRAYELLERLGRRNHYDHGPDIPANHVPTNGMEFRNLLLTLKQLLLDRPGRSGPAK